MSRRRLLVGQAGAVGSGPSRVERRIAARGAAARDAASAVHWIYWKARLLAALQRRAEAGESLLTFEQLRGRQEAIGDSVPIYLLLGRHADVLGALEKSRATAAARKNPRILAAFVNNLRLNPEWDLLRAAPRFAALIGAPNSP